MKSAAYVHWCVANNPRKSVFFPPPREKQVQYLELAKTYLECNEPQLSLKCLSYAKEFQLSAQLCERLGQVGPLPGAVRGRTGLPLSSWGTGGGGLPPPVSGRGLAPAGEPWFVFFTSS